MKIKRINPNIFQELLIKRSEYLKIMMNDFANTDKVLASSVEDRLMVCDSIVGAIQSCKSEEDYFNLFYYYNESRLLLEDIQIAVTDCLCHCFYWEEEKLLFKPKTFINHVNGIMNNLSSISPFRLVEFSIEKINSDDRKLVLSYKTNSACNHDGVYFRLKPNNNFIEQLDGYCNITLDQIEKKLILAKDYAFVHLFAECYKNEYLSKDNKS